MPETIVLEDLLAEVRNCRVCWDEPAGKPLPHEPRPVVVASRTARILIAGQAPGTRVHASGIPFDDPSGDRLRDWLGVGREQFCDPANFAILPMGFCFPGFDAKGGDLPPRRECAQMWREKTIAQMPQIDLILVIGQYAQAWHLGARREKTLTETVKNWRAIFCDEQSGQKALALPHPSWRNSGWLKRNPWFEADLLPVLQREVASRIR